MHAAKEMFEKKIVQEVWKTLPYLRAKRIFCSVNVIANIIKNEP